MRLKARILWALLGMSLLVAIVGGRAISRQRDIGQLEAGSEAEEDARVFAFIAASDQDGAHALSEKAARYMYGTLGRDIEVVDASGRIIADSIPAEVGGKSDHSGDALALTLRDGGVRTFEEVPPGHSSASRFIVAPVKSDSGRIIGAVTEEYTPIYNEFMAITEATTIQVVVAALAGVLLAVVLSLYIGASIVRPLRQLTRAAVGFAAGEDDVPMPPPRNDEIGDLTVAFKVMMDRRRQAEQAQLAAREALAETNEQLQREVAERRHAETVAREGEERGRQLADDLTRERGHLTDILETIPAVVFENWSMGDISRRFINGYLGKMFGYTPEEWFVSPTFWLDCVHPEDRQSVADHAAAVFSGKIPAGSGSKLLQRWIRKDKRVVWGETYLSVIRDPEGGTGIRGFTIDITEQKLAEQKLEEAHSQLLDASREAGKAEVATNVLHNVGNVLNSVNISATLAASQIRQSSVPHLARVAGLLRKNAGNLGAYITEDPAGQKLPDFLAQLAGQLEAEHASVLGELQHLAKYVEHIKDIVAVQQSYAGAAGVSQTIVVADLVEDSLRMNSGALTRHDVQVVREFEVHPVIQVDKHKAMQILVNLIRNAKYACDESGRPDKQLTLRVSGDERIVRISVIDNGVGIPAENLTRIFSHGFTTRKEGHGFGLHSSALAAAEMGGALLVQSAGAGQGATFTLELPLQSTNPS